MLDEDRFEFGQFFQALQIPDGDRPEVERCLLMGLRICDRLPDDSPLSAQLARLERRGHLLWVYGFGVVEGVRSPSLAIETRQRLVQFALQELDPTEKQGVPYGLPVMLSFLAQTGVLDGATFRSVMLLACAPGYPFSDPLQVDEGRGLLDWLVLRSGFAVDEQLWWLQAIAPHLENPDLGIPLADHLLHHPQLSVEFRRSLCQGWLSPTRVGELPLAPEVLQAQLHGDEMILQQVLFSNADAQTPAGFVPFTPTRTLLSAQNPLLEDAPLSEIPPFLQERAAEVLQSLSGDR